LISPIFYFDFTDYLKITQIFKGRLH